MDPKSILNSIAQLNSGSMFPVMPHKYLQYNYYPVNKNRHRTDQDSQNNHSHCCFHVEKHGIFENAGKNAE